MVLLPRGVMLSTCPSFSGTVESARQRLHNKLCMLQTHLELDQELTRYQPPQATVSNDEEGNARVVLLINAQLCWSYEAIRQASQGPISSSMLRGIDFRISERYRCLADPRGQVQGGVGFILEGIDLTDNTKVAVKFFHKTCDETASARINAELVTCLRFHQGLHAASMGPHDDIDLRHLTRLRDVLVNAPILEECNGALKPPMFSATAIVFDWADGGDAHSLIVQNGSVSPAEGADLFRQLLRGLRALHRRGIVHRDIKPENLLLNRVDRTACLCDLGFAKHVPSVLPADLSNDPTSCYQSPERWLACHSLPAVRARAVAAAGAGVARRDETPDSLFASDIFSAGVTLFMLVGYNAILTRIMTDTFCSDVEDGSAGSLPAMNVFQQSAGGGVFALLRADVRAQDQLWSYWEAYGLRLPPAMKGLLDGVLHPVPENRFSLEQCFAWFEAHPDMFEA